MVIFKHIRNHNKNKIVVLIIIVLASIFILYACGSNDRMISEEKPPDERVISEEEPSDDSAISEEEPSDERVISEEKPPYERVISDERPSDERVISEKGPSEAYLAVFMDQYPYEYLVGMSEYRKYINVSLSYVKYADVSAVAELIKLYVKSANEKIAVLFDYSWDKLVEEGYESVSTKIPAYPADFYLSGVELVNDAKLIIGAAHGSADPTTGASYGYTVEKSEGNWEITGIEITGTR